MYVFEVGENALGDHGRRLGECPRLAVSGLDGDDHGQSAASSTESVAFNARNLEAEGRRTLPNLIGGGGQLRTNAMTGGMVIEL